MYLLSMITWQPVVPHRPHRSLSETHVSFSKDKTQISVDSVGEQNSRLASYNSPWVPCLRKVPLFPVALWVPDKRTE